MNNHVRDDENTYAQHSNGFQKRFGINAWAGIVDDRLIGPYLLPPHPRVTLIFSSCRKYLANYWKMYHWTSVDASSFDTMAHHPILWARFVITLTDVSGNVG